MKTRCFLPSALPLVLFSICLVSFAPLQTRGDIALSFASYSGQGPGANNATIGWSFSLSTNIQVTDLGVWDGNNSTAFGPTGDGLLNDQLITIWTSTGTFVTSATVPAGGGTLASDFRYVSIAPTLLNAGDYVIGSFYTTSSANQDPNAEISSTITTAAGVTYGEGLEGAGNAFPTIMFSGGGVWGPNFQFVEARNVPEAGASWILLALALVAIFSWRLLSPRRVA